jgi:hypothetical protein
MGGKSPPCLQTTQTLYTMMGLCILPAPPSAVGPPPATPPESPPKPRRGLFTRFPAAQDPRKAPTGPPDTQRQPLSLEPVPKLEVLEQAHLNHKARPNPEGVYSHAFPPRKTQEKPPRGPPVLSDNLCHLNHKVRPNPEGVYSHAFLPHKTQEKPLWGIRPILTGRRGRRWNGRPLRR